MTWIWTLFLALSVCSAICTNNTSALAAAALNGASAGIQLIISMAGPICLWSGLNHMLTELGVMERLARFLSPMLGRLFPISWRDRAAREAISCNLSANLLGMGNAATPPGILAVRRMTPEGSTAATDEMCRLIVMNTASIQLIPATVAAVRAGLYAAHPFDILPAVWVTSLCALTVGLLTAKVLSRWM